MSSQRISVVPVVLCGGSGTRLWPLSRTGFPKQFLALAGKDSLFQQAVARLNSLGAQDLAVKRTLVVTNEEHRFLAQEQLREMGDVSATLLLEPCARNTAAALTLAALQAMELESDPVLVASPADQTIGDTEAFISALSASARLAYQGGIVILGVPPIRPETGYGYIQFEADKSSTNQSYSQRVLRFVEKPNQQIAQEYLASGDFAWNSGLFVLKASTWLNALKLFRPDILQACELAWTDRQTDQMKSSQSDNISAFDFVRPDALAFSKVPSESVDYAVLEKCPGSLVPIHMLNLVAGWSDLGAWDAVWQVEQAAYRSGTDAQGNVCKGDVLLADSSRNYVHSSGRLVSLVGVSDLAVIETADAVLVADKRNSQSVKKIVALLEANQRTEHLMHRKVHRPWGWYDSVDEGDCFKVKRIMVKPGASLSLQKHQYRAEHWIVVKGTALVTCGSQSMTLTENQSTYIPIGEVHRLANMTDSDLEIIEVQSGSYLGEDDIVRLEDTYGRK